MIYRKRWWQFWRPICKCLNKIETGTEVDDCMPSGGPNSKGSFMMATGSWRWHYERCQDCGKIYKWGHWD